MLQPCSLLPLFLVNGPLAPKTPCQDPGVSLNTNFFHHNSASQVPPRDHPHPCPSWAWRGLPAPQRSRVAGSVTSLSSRRRKFIVETLTVENINQILQIELFQEKKNLPSQVRASPHPWRSVRSLERVRELSSAGLSRACQSRHPWHISGGRTWLHKEVAVLTQTYTCQGVCNSPALPP